MEILPRTEVSIGGHKIHKSGEYPSVLDWHRDFNALKVWMMAMPSMFLAPPPSKIPAKTLYREKQHFGRICRAADIETPQRFLFHGLDPNSLQQNMEAYLISLSEIVGSVHIKTVEGPIVTIKEIGIEDFLNRFLRGG